MDSFQTQRMPFNAEAELSVLGAVLLDSSIFSDIAVLLKEEDFYIRANAEIYGAMYEMFSFGEPIDLVTLIAKLEKRGTFEETGGAAYLARLIEMVPGSDNAVEYAKIVAGKSNLRKLIDTSGQMITLAMSGEDSEIVLDRAEQSIYEIVGQRNLKDLIPIKDVLITEYERLHQLSVDKNAYLGVETGFSALDAKLIGLNKSDLIIVAARPGVGKTALALNLATNIAFQTHKSIAFFSLEMSKEQLVSRMLSSTALVDNVLLRTANLSDEDWQNLAIASTKLSMEPIFIDDTSSINVTEIKAKCRRIKDLGLVVIDYIQLMQGSKRSENRVQEVSEISRSLKIMAKELDVPVVCCAQVSRGPESRTDKRPILSDLRESGALEQDADVVLFLYRDDLYNEDSDKKNIAECIIAKNRHGETGKCELLWTGQYTRFSSIDYREEEYD